MSIFPEEVFPNNTEVLNAYNIAELTNKSLYITGKAGTGKSTFLKHFCENTKKNYLILAPTGIAALNVGGQTIHSFFGLPLRPLQPNDKDIPYFSKATFDKKGDLSLEDHPKRKIIQNLDVIIIDEISMVRADIMDAIDNSLRKNGGSPHLPFGGKQIIFFGDLFQLEPVVTKEDRPILFRFYKSPFFFSAQVFKQIQLSKVEFTKVYRQSNRDFIGLLDRIRNGKTNEDDIISLMKRVDMNYKPPPDEYFIILCSKNAIANQTNSDYLKNLKTPIFNYQGEISGEFPNKLPTPLNLKLKVEVQVMFVKNDSGGRWANGTIGKIVELTDEGIKVKIQNENEIEIEEEVEYWVDRVQWENIEYKWNEEKKEIESEVIGVFRQYPIKLAWAITIHKSQGLTFDKVIIDSGSGMFAHGQCYVALSRCTSFEGIILKNYITERDIIIKQSVIDFANTVNNQANIDSELVDGLIDENKRLKESNAAFNNEIKSLHHKIKEGENQLLLYEEEILKQVALNNQLEKDVETTNRKLDDTNKKLVMLKKDAIKSSEIISNLKEEIKTLTKEIDHLKNIKWHQKLFGKK